MWRLYVKGVGLVNLSTVTLISDIGADWALYGTSAGDHVTLPTAMVSAANINMGVR